VFVRSLPVAVTAKLDDEATAVLAAELLGHDVLLAFELVEPYAPNKCEIGRQIGPLDGAAHRFQSGHARTACSGCRAGS